MGHNLCSAETVCLEHTCCVALVFIEPCQAEHEVIIYRYRVLLCNIILHARANTAWLLCQISALGYTRGLVSV